MQPTTSQQALSQLESTEQSAQDPNAILQAQNQQYGVNSQQQTVQGLQGAINNTTKLLQQVAPSVMGRTGNSLVTAAQASKQVENEQAPISTNLSNQTDQYNQANSQLSTDEQQAQTAASGVYQGQQDKLSYLQNVYNNLYQGEQAAAAQSYQQQQLAEQAREADESSKAASSSNLGSVLSSLLGGSTSGGAQMQQRSSDSGFNFQDANGGATNAVGYSQAKDVPIRTLLQNMANSGDAGAKAALNYVGNDYGINIPKLQQLGTNSATYQKTVSLLQALGFKL